jgi:hypothetical protein
MIIMGRCGDYPAIRYITYGDAHAMVIIVMRGISLSEIIPCYPAISSACGVFVGIIPRIQLTQDNHAISYNKIQWQVSWDKPNSTAGPGLSCDTNPDNQRG